MIVVFDTGVWVSALEYGGVPQQAISHAFNEEQLAVSGYIEAEILRILTVKFDHDPIALQIRLDEFLTHAIIVETRGEISGVCHDPDDDAILETAWKAQADYLVAGDKELLALKEFRGIAIVTPAAYLRLT